VIIHLEAVDSADRKPRRNNIKNIFFHQKIVLAAFKPDLPLLMVRVIVMKIYTDKITEC